VVRCQVLSDERVMGDAAMNVAASGGGSGSGSGSGGGQRIVKEGWLQKRGTVDAICVSHELLTEFLELRYASSSRRSARAYVIARHCHECAWSVVEICLSTRHRTSNAPKNRVYIPVRLSREVASSNERASTRDRNKSWSSLASRSHDANLEVHLHIFMSSRATATLYGTLEEMLNVQCPLMPL